MVIGETLVAEAGATTVCGPGRRLAATPPPLSSRFCDFSPERTKADSASSCERSDRKTQAQAWLSTALTSLGHEDIVTAGVDKVGFEGCMELARFNYQLTVVSPTSQCSAHFIILFPMWERHL